MKVLCAALPGAGHGHPMLSVARALLARGHEVMVVTGSEHQDEVGRLGASFVQMPLIEGSPVEALRPFEDAAEMARRLAPDVVAFGPDAAVVDLITLGGALAADVAGIPWATLSIHPLHTPSRHLPPFGFGGPPGRGIARLRDGWMRWGQRRNLERARADLNRARAALGLAPATGDDPALSPTLIMVATLPALEIPRPDWPDKAVVVGPCLWRSTGEPVDLPAGDGPVVGVAASTAHDQGGLVRAAATAIERAGARGVITTGKAAPPTDLPPGIVAVRFADHDALIPSCDVVVTNGGHGIVARTLSHGVPLVVVPGPGDQAENAYRVERAGAGVRARPQRLGGAISRVIGDPRFRRAACAIAEEAATMDGPARAAELVETLRADQATLRRSPR